VDTVISLRLDLQGVLASLRPKQFCRALDVRPYDGEHNINYRSLSLGKNPDVSTKPTIQISPGKIGIYPVSP
jgi:hypothetical protein